MTDQKRISVNILPTTWLGRVAAVIVTAGLAVIGLFFLAFALITAAVLAALVAVRVWWVVKKLRNRRDQDVIEGSFSVEPGETPAVQSESIGGDRLPPSPK